MRLILAAALFAGFATVSMAADDLPEGVEQAISCSTVYSLHSDELREKGDEAGAAEFFNMGDALRGQAVAGMENAGFSADQVNDVEMNYALIIGFGYGSDPETMLADCLAAWDSP